MKILTVLSYRHAKLKSTIYVSFLYNAMIDDRELSRELPQISTLYNALISVVQICLFIVILRLHRCSCSFVVAVAVANDKFCEAV